MRRQPLIAFAAGTILLAMPWNAQALSCNRAQGAVELAVCGNAELKEADAALSGNYDDLHAVTHGRVRREFEAQQRAWVIERNTSCASGAVACLKASYAARQAQFDALLPLIAVPAPQLEDVTPLVLHGAWIMDGFLQPENQVQFSGADLEEAARKEGLPALGQVVTGRPGEICYDGDCVGSGLVRSTLGKIEGGGLVPILKLPAATPAFWGTLGSPYASVELIQQRSGTLLARFGMCVSHDQRCATAFQVWKPQTPDARVVSMIRD